MSDVSIRFYVTADTNSAEFQNMAAKAGCTRHYGTSYVQFSNSLIHLQPSSFLPDELVSYLSKMSVRVTLWIGYAEISYLLPGLQKTQDFSLVFGKTKIASTEFTPGKKNSFLLEAESYKALLQALKDFLPGLFPQIAPVPAECLRGMSFLKKIKYLISMLFSKNI